MCCLTDEAAKPTVHALRGILQSRVHSLRARFHYNTDAGFHGLRSVLSSALRLLMERWIFSLSVEVMGFFGHMSLTVRV